MDKLFISSGTVVTACYLCKEPATGVFDIYDSPFLHVECVNCHNKSKYKIEDFAEVEADEI